MTPDGGLLNFGTASVSYHEYCTCVRICIVLRVAKTAGAYSQPAQLWVMLQTGEVQRNCQVTARTHG